MSARVPRPVTDVEGIHVGYDRNSRTGTNTNTRVYLAYDPVKRVVTLHAHPEVMEGRYYDADNFCPVRRGDFDWS